MSVLIQAINNYTQVWVELSSSVISNAGADPIMQIRVQKQFLDNNGAFVCNVGDPVCIQQTFSALLGLGLIPPQFPAARAAGINVIINALAATS